MPVHGQTYDAIVAGDRKAVLEHVQSEVAAKADVRELLNETMIPAMREVGERFSRNEIYVPDMLISARAMQTGLGILEPLLASSGYEPRARVCIGTVKGDLHDIGKNLVAMMLKGAGFEVDDIGVDCGVERFDEAVDRGACVVCVSALLTTTMPYMKEVIDRLAPKQSVKVVVGGAPVTQEFADEIGAHGFGLDANAAVQAVEACVSANGY